MPKVEVVTTKKGIKPYIHAVGRRREAVARVRLYTNGKVEGMEVQKGETYVNGKPFIEYFRFKTYAPMFNKFLLDVGVSGKHIVTSKVAGGGIDSQLDALILGVARALDKFDTDTFHTVLREKGYLTRDPRTRERRKKSSPKR